MTTILRSSKYIRCLNALARRIIVANDNSRTVLKRSLELRAKCGANFYLSKSYATAPAIQRTDNVPNFDKSFAKLDDNIQRYGRLFKAEVEGVLANIREFGYVSTLDALLLIRCCGHLLVDIMPGERNKLVDDIWNTLELLKIPIDVSHFNALLRVYLENNHEFSPIKFLTTMKNKGVEPNRITYQRLMLHNCKKGDIEGAMKILEVMREKGIPLSEGVFSALIIGHSEANDLESAKNVINIMKEAGVVPSSGTYTALLNAYAKRGDMASIKRTLEEFGTKNLFLQDNDYFEVIQTLAANDHTEKIDGILELMPKGPNYNLDASQAILKILDVGNIDAALKVLPTMTKRRRANEDETAENENGTFLIRKLVTANFPTEQIVDACERLYNQDENKKSYLAALEKSLHMGNADVSYALMEAWRKKGGEIREHFFWPLITIHGRTSNYQGIIDVVKTMITKFDVVPTSETLRDYVLPYTGGKWDDIVASMRELRLPHDTVISSIACRMLLDHKTRKSATFMLNYPARHEIENFYRPLFDALKSTEDARSFALILRILCDSSGQKEAGSAGESPSIADIVDRAMNVITNYIPARKYSVIEKVLEHLVETGLSMSPETGNELRKYFADNMNPLIDESIEKLTSGSLKPVPISDLAVLTDSDNMRELGRDKQRVPFAAIRRDLATAIENDNIAEIQRITEILDSQDFIYSPALYCQIIEVFCKAGDLEMSEKWLQRYKNQYPDSMMDIQKTTIYATLLIKNDRFDDAIQFIKQSPRINNPESNTTGLRVLSKSLLDVAADTGNVEKTNELFNALVENNYIVIENFMLSPLIKVHLVRDDVAGALKAFETACEKHNCTPMKNELSRRMIDKEDAESLQRLTDLSTQIHGENNSLVDLVVAFIECNRLRQARKILETPGLKLRDKKLRTIAERFAIKDDKNLLNQLTDLTKGLPIIDRRDFYDILMEAYNSKNNWECGMNLWTSMQDEDVQPSDKFLQNLADLLRRNDQPIPFASEHLEKINTTAWSQRAAPKMVDFYAQLEKKNLAQAEMILSNITSNDPEFSSAMSALITVHLKEKNDLNKAAELAEGMIVKHRRLPRANALKAVWNAFIDNNEFEKLRQHGDILDAADKSNVKRLWRFNKYLARADLKELGVEKFLANLEEKLNAPGCDKKLVVRETIHFATLIDEMKKNPAIVDQFFPFADNLYKENVMSPINLLWCYYFEQNKPEADEIWDKYLSEKTYFLFKYIIDQATRNNDLQLAERLYKQMRDKTNVAENPIVFAFTTLIDVCTANGNEDKAMEIVDEARPSVVAEWTRSNQGSVKRLKDLVGSRGKSFNLKTDNTRRPSETAE